MSSIFIFHGVGGFPEENWFPWLKTELQKVGHPVIVPQFPTPDNQTLENWLKVLEKYHELITPETILIGHSLGVPFALNVIEKYPVRAAFLVAGFVGQAGNEFDDSMKTFAQKEFNWPLIKTHCPKFTIFHADNDPYIKLAKAHELADYLGVKVNIVPNAGHFNSPAGYDTFELLLEEIKVA